MKKQTIRILFRICSFLSDRTKGMPLIVRYKLLLGAMLVVGFGAGSCSKETTTTCYTSINPSDSTKITNPTCYLPAIETGIDSSRNEETPMCYDMADPVAKET